MTKKYSEPTNEWILIIWTNAYYFDKFLHLFSCLQYNIANPTTGQMKVIEIDDDKIK